jgi:hypothetical protein
LPKSYTSIHPVFHVSLLRPFRGTPVPDIYIFLNLTLLTKFLSIKSSLSCHTVLDGLGRRKFESF